MSTKAVLSNPIYTSTGANGVYTISNATYLNLNDSGNGAYDLNTTYLVYVPLADNQDQPLLGEIGRFKINSLTVHSPGSVTLEISYDGYENFFTGNLANGLPCVICEPSPNGVGSPVSEELYGLPNGTALGIAVEDLKKFLSIPTNPWIPSSGNSGYTFIQSTPQNPWVIVHPLFKYPTVVVIDSSGNQVYGDVHYDSFSQVTLTFGGAFSGEACLS